MYFHGPGPGLPIDAQFGTGEVGPAVLLDTSGFQHFHRATIGGAQGVLFEEALLPDELEQVLAVGKARLQQTIGVRATGLHQPKRWNGSSGGLFSVVAVDDRVGHGCGMTDYSTIR